MPLAPRRLALGFLAAVLAPLSAAQAAGDSARGRVLAQTWCSSCHTVEGTNVGKDVAPTFGSIAEKGHPDQLEARAFLNAPHPPMPDFNLSRDQIDDIVAYLKSLAPHAAPRGTRNP